MSPRLRRLFACLVLVVFAARVPSVAQTDARNNAEADGSELNVNERSEGRAPVNPKYTTPKSPLDTAYGAKIAEYTTEKYFMTELVDHLPLSDKVPSPDKVLGYVDRHAKQAHLHKRSLSLLSRACRSVAARARLHRAGKE